MKNIRPSSTENIVHPSSQQQGDAADIAKTVNELTAKPQLDCSVNAFAEEFPSSIFPERLNKLIKTLNKKRNWLYNYTAASILFVISVIVGKRTLLATALGNIFANLYIALVGPKGGIKTHPLGWAINYLIERDIEEEELYRNACKEYERALKKGEQGAPPSKPKRYLTNDFTIEALHDRIANNRNGLGIAIDELSRVFNMSGRYTKTNDEDAYLSLFSGVDLIIDRKTSDSIIIRKPYVSLCGTIQPEILKKLFKGGRSENGFIDRFLIVPCYSYYRNYWNLELCAELDHLEKDYSELLEDFIKFLEPYDHANPAAYTLSDEAIETIQLWQHNHEDDCMCEPNHHIAAFRKVQIYVLKFALLLQIVWDICTGKENPEHKISAETAIRAEILADYFFETAKDITGEVTKNTLSSKEKTFYEALPCAFTSSQAVEIGKTYGFGRSSTFNFIGRIRGILIEESNHRYYKKNTPFKTSSSLVS